MMETPTVIELLLFNGLLFSQMSNPVQNAKRYQKRISRQKYLMLKDAKCITCAQGGLMCGNLGIRFFDNKGSHLLRLTRFLGIIFPSYDSNSNIFALLLNH